MLQDLDELEEQCSGLVSPRNQISFEQTCHSVTYDKLLQIKELLLGSRKRSFSDEWRIQTFALQSRDHIFYGLVQKKGGPCGVLACVQAYLLRELYFGDQSNSAILNTKTQREKQQESKLCLTKALSQVLWKCGNEIKAVIAFPQKEITNDCWPYPKDGFSEKIRLFYFDNVVDAQKFINDNFLYYSFNEFSLISFLYSALLSRGIDLIKSDMDDPRMPLIGMHGYCTQEIINLLLTGFASSNVFDGTKQLGNGNGQNLQLQGIQQKSDIGFLTLMEHQQACQVGEYFKDPLYPIWVICSESHFTVLFSKKLPSFNAELDKTGSTFDLYYYDGLIGQEDEIHLTLSYADKLKSKLEYLVSPLEHCIRTNTFPSSISVVRTKLSTDIMTRNGRELVTRLINFQVNNDKRDCDEITNKHN